MDRSSLWDIMSLDGIDQKLLTLIQAYYRNTRAKVKVYGELSDSFEINSGVRQGCPLSPILFNYLVDWVLRTALQGVDGVEVGPENVKIADLEYADDIAIMTNSRLEMQRAVKKVAEVASRVGLNINVGKTKVMSTEESGQGSLTDAVIDVMGEAVEEVQRFKYLGSIITPSGQPVEEVKARISAAHAVFAQLNNSLWRRREISLRTKIKIYKAVVRSVLLYGAETWCMRVEERRQLEVFDHSCLRRVTRTRWQDRISNADVRVKCELEVVTRTIQERRLRWLGHVLRRPDTEIVNQVLHAKPLRGWKQRRGGQRKTWLDTVKEDVTPLSGPTVYGLKTWNQSWLQLTEQAAKDRKMWRASVRDLLEQAKSSTMRAG